MMADKIVIDVHFMKINYNWNNEILYQINTALCHFKVNSNTIELTVTALHVIASRLFLCYYKAVT